MWSKFKKLVEDNLLVKLIFYAIGIFFINFFIFIIDTAKGGVEMWNRTE